MKTKKTFLFILFLFLGVIFLTTSCSPESTTENEEIYSIDKDDIKRPGT